MDERDFLTQALRSPHDPAPLIVAADWLDEQGDPQAARLADYVRRCVALAGRPVADEARRSESEALRILGTSAGLSADPVQGVFQHAVDASARGRQSGDRYRVVGRGIERRGGRGDWKPHEGEVSREVARQLLGHLAEAWSRPGPRETTAGYGGRTGNDRRLRGLLEQANRHAYQMHAASRDGFHAPVRDLRTSRAKWFQGWLDDAEDVVRLVEVVAEGGHQAPGEDARSLAYFGSSLDRLASGDSAGLQDEALVARARALWARYEAAMRRMGAPRVLPANAGEAWRARQGDAVTAWCRTIPS